MVSLSIASPQSNAGNLSIRLDENLYCPESFAVFIIIAVS
jgi:hypothetical protein